MTVVAERTRGRGGNAPTTHHRRRSGVAIAAVVNAWAACGGAVGLATGTVELDRDLNARLPFASPVLAGVALAIIVALPFTTVAVLAWRGDVRMDVAAEVAGSLLVAWIVVQLTLLRAPHPLHALYLTVGGWFVWHGRMTLVRRSRERRRRSGGGSDAPVSPAHCDTRSR